MATQKRHQSLEHVEEAMVKSVKGAKGPKALSKQPAPSGGQQKHERTVSGRSSPAPSRAVRSRRKALRNPHKVLGRLAILPRGMSQSVPVSCAHLVSFPSVDSCYGLVGGARLGVYVDQWDRITCNVFMRNVVRNGSLCEKRCTEQSYVLEFAQGNAPLISRVPIAFELTSMSRLWL